MDTKLVAVPVGRGDAFYFEHGDRRILVDGGQSVEGFSEMFQLATGASELDLLVCTHADSDHANGVLGLLRSGNTPVREVWLPGRWTDRLMDLARDPQGFAVELAGACNESSAETLEAHASRVDVATEDQGEQESTVDAGAQNDLGVDGLLDAVAETDGFPRWLPPHFLRWELLDVLLELPEPRSKRLFLEAIETAERIIKIAHWAVQRGSRLRWFDYGRFSKASKPDGGDPDFLPMNSQELTKRRSGKTPALDFLSLSVANRESLVFLGQDNQRRGVLFTADSDLHFTLGAEPPAALLATAPHHGADANQAAYSRVLRWFGRDELGWVRSDSASKKRPGKAYVSTTGFRCCTLCNPASRPKAKVVVNGVAEAWVPAGAPCTCAAQA